MSKHHPFGGRIVRHRIAEVEKRMAAGEEISAGPMSEEDKAALREARERNRGKPTE